MVEIYYLSDPETHEMKYIGKANDSKKRLQTHIRDSRRRKTPVCLWVKSLTDRGLVPAIKVIVRVPVVQWKETEVRLIEYYKQHHDLLNVAKGGGEPHCSKEVRASNGRKVASEIHADPARKQIWKYKQRMGQFLHFFKRRKEIESYNRQVDRMVELARRFPEYSSWSTLKHI